MERPAQAAETQDTSALQADLADPSSQPGSSDVRVLDSKGTLISADSAAAEPPAAFSPSVSVPLFSGDQASPTPVSAVPSVSDSVLAQLDVPSPSDVPPLDLTQPDENSDDDEMGDSVAPLEAEKLATAWKRVSREKGQRRKNLARKATNSHSFAPVREATRPNPPGVRPNRGKDPPE